MMRDKVMETVKPNADGPEWTYRPSLASQWGPVEAWGCPGAWPHQSWAPASITDAHNQSDDAPHNCRHNNQ